MPLLRCREAVAQGKYAASYVLQLCLWTVTECFLNKDSGELQHLSAKNRDVFLKNASQKSTQEEVQFQAFSWRSLTGGLCPVLQTPKTCPPTHHYRAMENTLFQNLPLEILWLYRSTVQKNNREPARKGRVLENNMLCNLYTITVKFSRKKKQSHTGFSLQSSSPLERS